MVQSRSRASGSRLDVMVKVLGPLFGDLPLASILSRVVRFRVGLLAGEVEPHYPRLFGLGGGCLALVSAPEMEYALAKVPSLDKSSSASMKDRMRLGRPEVRPRGVPQSQWAPPGRFLSVVVDVAPRRKGTGSLRSVPEHKEHRDPPSRLLSSTYQNQIHSTVLGDSISLRR